MSDKLQGGILAGSTSLSLPVVLRKTSDNTEQTGKVAADMTLSYWRQGGTRTAISGSDLAAVNSAYSSGGVKEVDSTNEPGLYRLDVPDAAFATGADWVVVSVKVASTYVFHERFALTTNVIQTGDCYAREGAPAGASISADIAAVKALLPTALVGGKMDSHVNDIANDAITAASINADAITAAKVADGTIDAATFAAGAINAAAIASGAITNAKFAAGAIDAAAIATDAIDADSLKADAVTEIQSGLATSAALATVQADTDDIQTRLPAALVGGRMDSSVGAIAVGVDLTATMKTSVTTAATAATPTAAAVTGNVGGNVVGSVGSVAAGGIVAASFAAGAIDAAAIATDAIGSAELAASAITEISAGVRTELTTELGRIDVATSTRLAPTTAGRTLDVTATGEAGIDWANIGAPTTTVNLSGTTVKTATDVEADTQDIQSRLPAALVSGRIDASVGAMAANVVTAAAIATDAIDADALKTDAVTEIQSGLSTLTAAGVRTAVGLASANLDTQFGALPTAAENADAAWDELLSGHAVPGSAGEALSSASAGGNPWTAVLDGVFTAQDLLRIAAAGMGGKTSITDTTFGATVVFRDVSDASDIIAADVGGTHGSERLAVTLTP